MLNKEPALQDATMSTYTEDGMGNQPCQVRRHDDQLLVSYTVEDAEQSYTGREIEPGHFEMHATHNDGRASLHCFGGSTIYEGFWEESGQRGMWRIRLDDADDDQESKMTTSTITTQAGQRITMTTMPKI